MSQRRFVRGGENLKSDHHTQKFNDSQTAHLAFAFHPAKHDLKQLPDRNLSQLYKRARYYDGNTNEFCSKDPLEYVDGMSLYRGYFAPGEMDPYGSIRLLQEGVGIRQDIENRRRAKDATSYAGHEFDMLDWLIDILSDPSIACLAQCYLLGMTDETIDQFIDDLFRDWPAATRAALEEIISSIPGRGLTGAMGLLNLLRFAQGYGLSASVLKRLELLALKGRVLGRLRQKLRTLLVRMVGRNASKLVGRQGVKMIPGANAFVCLVEAGTYSECHFACEDGRYTNSDTFEELTKNTPRDGDALSRCPPNMHQGPDGQCYYRE